MADNKPSKIDFLYSLSLGMGLGLVVVTPLIAFLLLGLSVEAYIMHTAFARWFSIKEMISFVAAIVLVIGFVVTLAVAITRTLKR